MNTLNKAIYSDITFNYKMWLSSKSGEGIMGDGKWLLLKTIDEQGSLKAAAETLGISYRKAWGDLNKIENLLGIALVKKIRGGKNGGNTFLTNEGKKLVKVYEQFHSDFRDLVHKAFKEFLKKLK